MTSRSGCVTRAPAASSAPETRSACGLSTCSAGRLGGFRHAAPPTAGALPADAAARHGVRRGATCPGCGSSALGPYGLSRAVAARAGPSAVAERRRVRIEPLLGVACCGRSRSRQGGRPRRGAPQHLLRGRGEPDGRIRSDLGGSLGWARLVLHHERGVPTARPTPAVARHRRVRRVDVQRRTGVGGRGPAGRRAPTARHRRRCPSSVQPACGGRAALGRAAWGGGVLRRARAVRAAHGGKWRASASERHRCRGRRPEQAPGAGTPRRAAAPTTADAVVARAQPVAAGAEDAAEQPRAQVCPWSPDGSCRHQLRLDAGRGTTGSSLPSRASGISGIEERATPAVIVDCVHAEYDVSRDVLERDVDRLLDDLLQRRLVEVAADPSAGRS